VAVLETLRKVPFFGQLRESDLAALASLVRSREYPKNSVVLFAHETCDAFYVLESGQVKVMLNAEDGREVILSLIRTGDFFGERSLMDDEPHAASVIAMEDSRILVLRRDEFRKCILEMPGVAFGLLRALLNRLRTADHKIGGLILLDVTGRVSHFLLQLADHYHADRIPDPPTHQIIAQMVGSSRETVSRTLRALVEQGLITVSRSEVVIRNREELEVAAGQLLRKRPKAPGAAPQPQRRSGPAPVVAGGRTP
jgi:CRP-like cAMP-binding protein